MRPEWYADKRDLLKWSALYHIAAGADVLIQVLFFRESCFGKVSMDNREKDIPRAVLSHFRDPKNIHNLHFVCKLDVFDVEFDDRQRYLKALLNRIASHNGKKKVVFLDPDTGLEPSRTASNTRHVLEKEIKEIWNTMAKKDVMVLYQHKTNRAGKPWVADKQTQLAKALGVGKKSVKIACGSHIADDVVLMYIQK